METFGPIIIIIIDIIIAILFSKLANKKGYPGVWWGIIGFFLPIIYLILLLLPTKNSKKEIKKITTEEKQKKDRMITTIFIILICVIIFTFIIVVGKREAERKENFKNYVVNTLVKSYLEIKTENFTNNIVDQKIYLQDLYKMYINNEIISSRSFVYDEDFADYYKENESELKDDTIVVYISKNNFDNQYEWYSWYYDSFNEIQEIIDYACNDGIDEYIKTKTNDFKEDVKDEKVYISLLFEEGYIKSDYIKKVYEKNQDRIKRYYIEVESQGGKIYNVYYNSDIDE